MVSHIALPAYEDLSIREDAPPAILSQNIMTKLLKEGLNFKGCVVSDAMTMIGATSRVSFDRLAVEFIKAGGDMVLCPETTDYETLIDAVKNNEISIKRLKDAVRRILILKNSARLFENQEDIIKDISVSQEEIEAVSNRIAEKSIKIVRDKNNLFPLNIAKGSKIMMCNIICPFFKQPPKGDEFAVMKEELVKRGYVVDYFDNIDYQEIKLKQNDYAVIFVNCDISPSTYHGGTMRIGWDNIMAFWKGYILKNPKMIFISFGDPYKIYEFPYLKEYVNAFSNYPETQKAVIKILFGEVSMQAKNPVGFKNYFEREV